MVKSTNDFARGESSSLPSAKNERWSFARRGLVTLAILELISVIGFATFALNPMLLATLPGAAAVYPITFPLFAQAQIWLAFALIVWYLQSHVGKRWWAAFVGVYLISLGSELSGTTWGIPFGGYAYSEFLGPKWLERVPWVIPISWFAMSIVIYRMAVEVIGSNTWIARFGRAIFLGTALVIWDVSLDPAMSYLTPYWLWSETGPFYGMPWINLFGWFVTGLALAVAFELTQTTAWIRLVSLKFATLFFVINGALPLAMNIAGGLWWAVLAAIILNAGLLALVYYANKGGSMSPIEAPRRRESSSTSQDVAISTLRNALTHDEARLLQPEPLSELAVIDTDQFFANNSRSFAFASMWFSPSFRSDVADLYRFCRVSDDLVDTAPSARKEELLEMMGAWSRVAAAAYVGEETAIPWLNRVMKRARKAGVPFSEVEHLLEGMAWDLQQQSYLSIGELQGYSDRVASVVGRWMTRLAGERRPEVLDAATSLGQAMQLTNIIRDVGQDLAMGRIYIPESILHRHALKTADLTASWRTASYADALETLMSYADAEYERALAAVAVLPTTFGRSVTVAAYVYRGIHDEVRRNRYNNISCRAKTSAWRKGVLAVRALTRFEMQRLMIAFGFSRPYLESARISKPIEIS